MRWRNKFNEFMNVVRDSLGYTIVEVVYLLGLIFDLWHGDGLSGWYPLLGAILIFLWLLISTTDETLSELEDMIYCHELFRSDFYVSISVLLIIAVIQWQASPWYSLLFGLAVGQYLRYTWLLRYDFTKAEHARLSDTGHPGGPEGPDDPM